MSKHGRITPRTENYADWYQDVIREGRLAEVAGVVKGCMVIKPHGYAIWEKIQARARPALQGHGPQERLLSAADPRVVPEAKEAEHVEGFSWSARW
jgi:prolyl-tRNA synthetase